MSQLWWKSFFGDDKRFRIKYFNLNLLCCLFDGPEVSKSYTGILWSMNSDDLLEQDPTPQYEPIRTSHLRKQQRQSKATFSTNGPRRARTQVDSTIAPAESCSSRGHLSESNQHSQTEVLPTVRLALECLASKIPDLV